MNIKSGFVLLIALTAGVLGGTAAYQVATPTSSSAEEVARESIVVGKGDRARDQGPKFAPCKRPATLQGGRCVTDVTRTVVVPGTPAPARSGSSGPGPAPVPFHASGDDNEGRHHGGEGESGHHGDDDDDWDDDHDDDRDDTDTATDTVSNDVTDTHGDDDGGTQTRTRTHD